MNTTRLFSFGPSTILFILALALSMPSICHTATIVYSYDQAGSLQRIRCSDGQSVDFNYDPSGNLISYNATGGSYPGSAFLMLLNDLRQSNPHQSILNK